MRTEYLVYFTEQPAYQGGKLIGHMPPHYMLCNEHDIEAALSAGGKDVSCNSADWREWEREQNLNYMHG